MRNTSSNAAGDAEAPKVRTTCLLSTMNPDRGLSIALQQNLSLEVPEIDFTLSPGDDVDSIWVCGYEAGQAKVVRTLRSRYPDAILLVTGRDPVAEWNSDVAQAGADFAFAWPVGYEVLNSILQGGLPSKSLRSSRSSLAL